VPAAVRVYSAEPPLALAEAAGQSGAAAEPGAELVRMTGRDESLLAFVCQLVQRAFKAFGAEDEPRLRLFVNLCSPRACAVCGCLLRHSAYQIVQLLAVKHRLSGSVLHMWIKRLLKVKCTNIQHPSRPTVVSQAGPPEVCLLVATLCRTQKCQVPDEFTERFLELCSACKSNVLNEFPDIVSRSTESVDIVFDENHSLVAKDAPAGVAMETKPTLRWTRKMEGINRKAPESRKEDKLKEKKLAARLAAENAVMKLFQTPGLPAESVPAAAAESAETAPDETGNATSDANHRSAATPSASRRRLLSLARPDGCSAGPTDESEEDAQMWDAVEALLNDARAIQHDRQWVMRQQLGPACCRLVWLSMAELAGGLAGCSALTPIQRRCLLGPAALPAGAAAGGAGRRAAWRRRRRWQRFRGRPAPWPAVTPAVFNTLNPAMKLAYLTEGLGSTPLTEDPDVLALACGYSVETVVYLDALAQPVWPAAPMPALISWSSGLQLVIRLLEVLPNTGPPLGRQTPIGRVSGLADLIPLQAVLSCARAVSDRSCQYAAVGLLLPPFAAWPQPAPPPAAAASLTFLVGG
uniref:HECT domain-containing protein n=1 Tax=Macrostomum lignano TaxID=282301 RepID=A0A1I8FAC6_9PLAT